MAKYFASKNYFGSPAYFADGTAAAPSISFGADTNTGLYRSTTDTIGFTASGAYVGTWTTSTITLNGDANYSLALARNTAAGTAKTFTVQGSGAKSGETNTTGGVLILNGGISTGSGASAVYIGTSTAGGSGTTDRTPTTKWIVDGNGSLYPNVDLTYAFGGSSNRISTIYAGTAGFGALPTATEEVIITPSANTVKGLTIKGAASQSANLLELQDSSGNVVTSIKDCTAIGATATTGLLLANNTAAADGVQQYSPALTLTGYGWKTDATPASQETSWRLYTSVTQGTAAPSSRLNFDAKIGSGSYSNQMNITSGGIFTAADIRSTTTVIAGANSNVSWAGRAKLLSPADGIVRLTNDGETGFTRLDFGLATNSASAIGFDSVNGFTLQSAAGTSTWNDASTAGSGTVANRYLFGIAAPTLTATNASTVNTVASTLYIGGAPTASTNVTIGTAYALNVAAGNSLFGGNLNTSITTTRGNIPGVSKYTVASTNVAFQAAATSATVALVTLPQYGKITGVTVKHSAQFSDGAGAMTSVTVSVGVAGTATAFTSAYEIGEASAVADTTFQDTAVFKSTTMAAAGVSVIGTFTSTGRDFGDGAGSTFLTGGSVDIYVEWVSVQ